MTTGSRNNTKLLFVRNGWPFYAVDQKSWIGGDTPPAQRPKNRITKKFSFTAFKRVDGIRIPYTVEKTVTRLVPARLNRLPPHDYVMGAKLYKQDYWLVKDGSVDYEGGLINELPFESKWDANEDIKLLGKLREEIAGSDFNLGVTLGESPKALDMITEHSKRIYLFYKNFRKGSFRRASDELFGGRKEVKRPSRAMASNFLAMKYGWLPLLSDVHSGAQFLAHNYNAPRVFRVVATRRLKDNGETSYDAPYWVHNTGCTVMANLEKVESKRIVALLTEVNVPQLAGLNDPLSVAWELVPYSFVIDWFIPVGNWLSARGLSQSLSGTYVTTYVNRQRLNYFWVKNQGGGNGKFTRRCEGTWSRVEMSRSVSNTLPVPIRPHFKALGDTLSWSRALTSVALLTNVKR